MTSDNHTSDVKSSGRLWAILTCGMLASELLISLYLFARSIILIEGNGAGSINLCRTILNADCDATLLSSESVVLGVPLAGWGLVYFGAMSTLLFAGHMVGEAFTRQAAVGALFLNAIGIIISIVLLGDFALRLVPVCILCILVHCLNILLFVAIVKMSGMTLHTIVSSVMLGMKLVVADSKNGQSDQLTWKTLGFVTCAFAALTLYLATSGYYQRAVLRAELNPSAKQILVSYMMQPKEIVPVAPDDARLGPEDSNIEIVVFSDFQCQGCIQFESVMSNLVESYPDSVSFVYKHYPLNFHCNPGVTGTRHPLSCEFAALSEVARRQGTFWEFQRQTHTSGRIPNDADLLRVQEELGLNSDQVEEVDTDRIQSHIEQAIALGVEATPTVFLNGRRVANPTEKSLELLILHQLGLALE